MSDSDTEVVLTSPRKCAFGDTCTDAEFDFRTLEGRWAYACYPHYVANRMYDDLGFGKGQRLIIRPLKGG